MVKHKTKYSRGSAIYFNLGTNTINENCIFKFYCNKTDITPTVVDGGNEIILANWPNDKHIICNINNDIPVRISNHPYILVNRSVLCNCVIEADNHYLLESLAACDNTNSKLIMYFIVTTAFVNCLDMLPNLTASLEFLVIKNRTMYKQTLPISVNISRFDKTLLTAPNNLKDFMNSYAKHKEVIEHKENKTSGSTSTTKQMAITSAKLW